MEDMLKEIPKEVIDTFFRKAAGIPQKEKPEETPKEKPKNRKKTLLFIISLSSLAIALSTVIIILYIIPYKKKVPKTVDLNRFHYTGHVVKNGLVNRFSIIETHFDGGASRKSAFLKNSIELTNSGNESKASLIIKFREYLDLDGKNILILARAKYGTKKINLILKDSQNRFYEYPGIQFSPNWNLKNIYLDKTSDIDLKRIKELELEFGSHTAGNKENSTIYLKDIIVRGTRE